MWNWLVDKLIARAKRTPFVHLYHADGSPYMMRYWLLGRDGEKNSWWPAIRLHHICTKDNDRHLHDHPWAFISVVLRGKYIEQRPVDISPTGFVGEHEYTYSTVRREGSVAFRWWTDRHYIRYVTPGGVWTLFVRFKRMHGWGFQTARGKIYHRDYESRHTAGDKS